MSGAAGRRQWKKIQAALLVSAASVCLEAAEIHWRPDARPIAVEVSAIASADLAAVDAAWRDVFAVFAEQGDAKNLPPMAGAWSVVSGNTLRFEPRFPLVHGVRYRAEYRAKGTATLVAFFELPAPAPSPATMVRHVYPSADVLPENQLKFYVQFSAPIGRGRAYAHIHIRDAAGRVIDLPFLELDEELWDPAMKRLTLLIDPGRIKRGVKPLVDIGPVFEAGKNYSLTIEADCLDAEGRPLGAAFEKKFRIGPADRTPPDPAKWKITPPASGSRTPLVIEFGEPMDFALASRMLNVARADGTELDGAVTLGAQEAAWIFAPITPWRAGAHRVVVTTTIEDLAGNNIGKPFDVDLFEDVQRKIETPTVEVAFVVK